MGHINPTYDTASIQDNEPQYMEIEGFQQPDVGFPNPHFNPEEHYQSLDNAHGRSDDVYMGLDYSQSEV